jgi:hypothetical protein
MVGPEAEPPLLILGPLTSTVDTVAFSNLGLRTTYPHGRAIQARTKRHKFLQDTVFVEGFCLLGIRRLLRLYLESMAILSTPECTISIHPEIVLLLIKLETGSYRISYFVISQSPADCNFVRRYESHSNFFFLLLFLFHSSFTLINSAVKHGH